MRYVHAVAVAVLALGFTSCDKPDMPTAPSALTGASRFASHTEDTPLRTVTHLTNNNDRCSTFNYKYEFKLEANSTGMNVAGVWDVKVLLAGVSTSVGTIEILTTDGVNWDWRSTFSLDAVISKGGTEIGHLYEYTPDSRGDVGLFSGVNSGGTRQKISHVSFCFELDPDAAIIADPYARRTWGWQLDKSTEQGNLKLNKGVSASITYTITATPTGPVDSGWRLDGFIKMRNEFSVPIAIAMPSVTINGTIPAIVNCGPGPLTLSPRVGGFAGPDGGKDCAFSAPLPNANPGTVAMNTATLLPEINDIQASANYAFTPADYELFNATAHVQDGYNGAAPANLGDVSALSGPKSFTYVGNVPGSDECTIETIVNNAMLNTDPFGTQGSPNEPISLHDAVSREKKVIGCLTVKVTTVPKWDMRYEWALSKSADETDVTAQRGSDVTVDYTVTATPTGTPINHQVRGAVTVTNTATYPATPDIVMPAGTAPCVLTAPLSPGASATCNYALPTVNTSGGSVEASASVEGSISVDGSASYDFSAPPADHIGDDVRVTDDFNGSGDAFLFDANASGGAATHTYSKTLPTRACDIVSYPNVATLKASETNQTVRDDWTVKLKVIGCIGIAINTDPGTFERTYSWSISKTASDQSVVTASGQEQVNVNYTITIAPTFADANFKLTGGVTVTNEASYPAVIKVTGVVACETPPLAPNTNHTCSFTLTPSGSAGGTVNASATVETSDAVSATASYAFGSPTVYGGTASVYDQFATEGEKLLGTAQEAARTFTYVKTFGGTVCGVTTYTNTARFEAPGSATTSDSRTVNVTHTITGCAVNTGCTLTQGYWKTHSTSGPAAHPDDTWNLLPQAQHTIFYLSGMSWLQVFRTPPAGNAYYTLAHQFMAATLNVMNGASAPQAVSDALAGAQQFFMANVPVPPAGKYKGRSATELNAWAALLDAYNNGAGPGHCDENRAP